MMKNSKFTQSGLAALPRSVQNVQISATLRPCLGACKIWRSSQKSCKLSTSIYLQNRLRYSRERSPQKFGTQALPFAFTLPGFLIYRPEFHFCAESDVKNFILGLRRIVKWIHISMSDLFFSVEHMIDIWVISTTHMKDDSNFGSSVLGCIAIGVF